MTAAHMHRSIQDVLAQQLVAMRRVTECNQTVNAMLVELGTSPAWNGLIPAGSNSLLSNRSTGNVKDDSGASESNASLSLAGSASDVRLPRRAVMLGVGVVDESASSVSTRSWQVSRRPFATEPLAKPFAASDGDALPPPDHSSLRPCHESPRPVVPMEAALTRGPIRDESSKLNKIGQSVDAGADMVFGGTADTCLSEPLLGNFNSLGNDADIATSPHNQNGAPRAMSAGATETDTTKTTPSPRTRRGKTTSPGKSEDAESVGTPTHRNSKHKYGSDQTDDGRQSKVFSGVSEKQRKLGKVLQDHKEGGRPEDPYKENGLWQSIVRHIYFKNGIMVLILANTLWIGIDTDLNKAVVLSDAPLVFRIFANLFTIGFLFEIVVRIGAFKSCTSFKDPEFLFDMFLTLLMVWDTWLEVLLYSTASGDDQGTDLKSVSILRIFRILRLLRVARMTRMLRALPELRIFIQGMIAAVRGTSVILTVLMLLIYMLSITFVMNLAETEFAEGRFQNIPQAMNFMFIQVLTGFDADFMQSLLQVSWPYYALWILYVLIGAFILLNMLVGLLVDVVSGTSTLEKEKTALSELEAEVEKLDIDGNRTVSKYECDAIINDDAVTKKLDALGVDVGALVEFADFVFEECPEMRLIDFVAMVVQFRGRRSTTVNDIVNLRRFVSSEVHHLTKLIEQLPKSLQGGGCQ